MVAIANIIISMVLHITQIQDCVTTNLKLMGKGKVVAHTLQRNTAGHSLLSLSRFCRTKPRPACTILQGLQDIACFHLRQCQYPTVIAKQQDHSLLSLLTFCRT